MSTHRSFRSAMTWLHTWSGLTLGWVLYAIFITGTAAYFRPEITAWMQPETAAIAQPADAARFAIKRLQEVAPDAKRWSVSIPDERSRQLTIYWQDSKPGPRFKNEPLDASAGTNTAPRATLGGDFFYRFHFQLMLPHPWGRYLACVAAMFMLVALVSGIVTHRRFFKDMFLFRLGRDGKRPWLDFHNVTAVLALPFYLMISYSALVIFTPMIMAGAAKFLVPPKPTPTAVAAATPAKEGREKPEKSTDEFAVTPEKFELMLASVEKAWGADQTFRRIEVTNLGTPKATVLFTRAETPSVSYIFTERDTLKFSGITAQPVEDPKPKPSIGARIRGVFYGLHLAHFAGPTLRTLFFLMGTMGAAMVGTGLVLWTLKRKDSLTKSRGGRFGYGLVSKLNITAITGLPIACASFLWANRLIPAAQAGRAETETTVFLIVWSVAALHAFIRPQTSAWKEQFIVAAFAFSALPVVDFFTAGRQLATWPRADGTYIFVTATLLLFGALFAYGAFKISKRQARSVAPKGVAS